MAAVCKCVNGHEFTSEVVEDSPEINYFEIADVTCPECGAEFEVVSVEYERLEDDVI